MIDKTAKKLITGATRTTISKTTLDAIQPSGKEFLVSDNLLTGFAIRVRENGSMSYVVSYRHGSGRGGIPRKYTISNTRKIAPDEARKIAKDILADAVKGGDPAREKMQRRDACTFAQLVADYLEVIRTKKKPNTFYLYRHWLEDLACPILGKKKADDVRTDEIERLHLSLAATSPTANRVLTTISSMYSWGMGPGNKILKRENPTTGIEKFREQGRERYLSDDELARLGEAIREAETKGIPWEPNPEKKVKHAPKPENRVRKIDSWAASAIRLFILTGARRGEILKLKWSQVDLQRGLIFLDDSKTNKKTIVLNAPAIAILNSLPVVDTYVIPGRPVIGASGQLESRPRSDLKRPWQLVRERAGLDASTEDPQFRVRIHDLRHTHASVGVGSNFSLAIIGKLLGHTQLKTTQRYAHLADNPIRNASEMIATRIVEAMGDERAET